MQETVSGMGKPYDAFARRVYKMSNFSTISCEDAKSTMEHIGQFTT